MAFLDWELFFTPLIQDCFPDDIKYIVNHAEDKYIFVDAPFLPIIENVISDLKTVKGIVVLTDKEHMPSSSIKNLICYEDLIADESEEIVLA